MSLGHSPQIITNGMVLCLDAANPKNYNLTEVEVLVVAGGGGGGMDMGGGGGGGGVIYNPNVTVTPGSSVTVTVGAGGAGAPAAGTNGQPGGHQYTISASNGGNSVFGALTAIGGGFGGSSYWGYLPDAGYGAAGGSGGGASGYKQGVGSDGRGGAGTAGQGFAGGGGSDQYYSGGGGGAGGAGVSGPNKPNGGPGVLYPSMSPYYFGGGGGGASYTLPVGGDGGVGGGGGGAVGTTYGGAGLNNGSPGGGGGNAQWTNTPGGNAGANTGGGGGGGAHYNSNNKGGDGGSGIVIVRYPGPQKAIGGTVTSVAGHTIHTFTTVGSTTFTPLVATNNSAILGLSDFSGNDNFGTTANSPTYSSANGGSVNCASNTIITVPMINLRPTTAITQECWFLTTNNVAQVFIGSQYGSDSNNSYALWLNTTNQWAAGVNIGGSFNYQTYNSTVSTNVWYHYVHTYDGANQRMYINGSQVHSWATTGLITYDTNNTLLAVGNDWNSGYNGGASIGVQGKISSVKIYNRALTAAEISQNFNALRGRYGI